MHIPVAPKCNIQCNYCNRKYDCSNESRPGITSKVLSPEEAVSKIGVVLEKIPNLKVIGIAGPGDALANEETFTSLELIKERYPDLIPCISTNGLLLPEKAKRLYDCGVRFVTVTINAPDAETGSKIYRNVLWDGKIHKGTEGAGILLENQIEGIRICAEMGMVVKANIVMIPGINTDVIPDLVRKVKEKGAYIVNILPLIPVPGTAFETLRGPTPAERKALMDSCSLDARMMRHCRQCRADAIGLLGEDRSSEFMGCGYGNGDGCGPAEEPNFIKMDLRRFNVAIASSDGSKVDSGFGNTDRFYVYSVNGDDVKLLRTVNPTEVTAPVVGQSHKDHINDIVNLLDDCDVIIVKEIGDMPRKTILSRGKKVVVTDVDVRSAVSSLD